MSQSLEDMEKNQKLLPATASARWTSQDKKDVRTPRPSRDVPATTQPHSQQFLGCRAREQRTRFGAPAKEVATASGSRNFNSQQATDYHQEAWFYEDSVRRGRGEKRVNSCRFLRYWPQETRHPNANTFFRKEHFIHANCQFVVSEETDVSLHRVDPDALLEWDKLVQVRLRTFEMPTCPICLYPPTAARMAKCGHIYCWPCALQYINYENGEKSRKCAICAELIYPDDLRRVAAESAKRCTVGESIEMVLMRREKGSTQLVPLEKWNRESNRQGNEFCRVVHAGPTQIHQLVQTEWEELSTALAITVADGTADEVLPYLRKLIGELGAQLMQMKGEAGGSITDGDSPLPPISSPDPPGPAVSPAEHEHHHQLVSVVSYEDAFQNEFSSDQQQQSIPRAYFSCNDLQGALATVPQPEEEEVEDIPTVLHPRPVAAAAADVYHFYQAGDGQHIYLHSLNWRCLTQEYGAAGWENWPARFVARVVQVDHMTITSDVRQRYRYLAHLPLSCPVSMVELDLQPPLISQATLDTFVGPLDKRRQERVERAKYDHYLTRRKQEAENRLYGPNADFTVVGSAMMERPRVPDARGRLFDESEFQPLTSPRQGACNVGATNTTRAAEVASSSCGAATPPTGDSQIVKPRSFADMMRSTNQNKTTAWVAQPPMTGATSPGIRQELEDVESSVHHEFAPPPLAQFSLAAAIVTVNGGRRGSKKKSQRGNKKTPPPPTVDE